MRLVETLSIGQSELQAGTWYKLSPLLHTTTLQRSYFHLHLTVKETDSRKLRNVYYTEGHTCQAAQRCCFGTSLWKALRCMLGLNKEHFPIRLSNLGVHQQLEEISSCKSLAFCPAVSHQGNIVICSQLVIKLKIYAYFLFQTLSSHFPFTSLVEFFGGQFQVRLDWCFLRNCVPPIKVLPDTGRLFLEVIVKTQGRQTCTRPSLCGKG